MRKKKAVVVHSGGMDSSICLYLAIHEFSKEEVISLSFNYGQRHSPELRSAEKICQQWNVDHQVMDLSCLGQVTSNALMNTELDVSWKEDQEPMSLVMGRNGLMARLAAIYAHQLGAHVIYMGVMEEEALEVGYRDCSRTYISLKEQILRMDLGDPNFEIRTPLVHLRKEETLEIAHEHGILTFLLDNTVTCYEGLPRQGCGKCSACFLKQRGISRFLEKQQLKRP